MSILFNHGLGDCVHMVHVLQLYKARGIEIPVHFAEDKRIIFEAGNVTYAGYEGAEHHDFSYYPDWNNPAYPEWRSNKICANIGKGGTPDIGEPADLWDELCRVDLEDQLCISAAATIKVAGFLLNLPRPIVLLHLMGTNFPESKNLPAAEQLALYNHLLDGMDGSLVILDWDNRVARLASARIRHLLSDFGPASVDELAALITAADLLIGVDSGPFHMCKMTKTPALGLFTGHHPMCVTLPRERNAVLTRDAVTNRPYRSRWSILQYHGNYPPPQDITRHAVRMLAGPRYLTDAKRIGRDVMLQQFVREFLRGGTGLSPRGDRDVTMDYVLCALKKFDNPRIVETGCTRQHENWGGDGHSTYILSAYIDGRGAGELISVDISPENVAVAAECTKQWSRSTQVCSDSIVWLRENQLPIDCLYLDSMDTEHPQHAQHGLAEIQAALHCLTPNAVVVWDDTTWSDGWKGKGALGVPWMLGDGWQISKCGYQVVLERKQPVCEEILQTTISHQIIGAEKARLLYSLMQQVTTTPGCAAEVGVYRGGTLLFLAKTLLDRTVYGYDTFTGMPPEDPDIDKHRAGEFANTSLGAVQQLLASENIVKLRPGVFPDSASGEVDETFCFVHIDGDLYSTTLAALEFFYPRLAVGGILAFDDYEWPMCPGVSKAINEFMTGRPETVQVSGYQAWLVKL